MDINGWKQMEWEEMDGNCCEWQELLVKAVTGWKWLKLAENECKQQEWLDITGRKWLQMAEVAKHFWNWLETDENKIIRE